ncbi:hypothetical protein AAFN85_30875 [Mucilaginibacter sp. CAU 1740]|uniref:hypothetical protein n=1 Tax=Mucilaginibacter sp. CAU 1740 TaxID=3140365 RepID=UPI00325B034C
MNPKFKLLYLIGGIVATILLIVQIVATYPNMNTTGIVLGALPALALFYLSYKAYHVKKDNELM